MARHQSPGVKQDLAKLEQDSESRRSALISLKAYVEKLDSVSVPGFLAQVSESRELDPSRHYAISLYEDVARVHGRLIVPHIPRVMGSVIRSLSASGGSVRMHQACSKVVAAIARFTIDAGAMAQAEAVFLELCRPLLDVLTARFEPLATGAALCLQAMVESEKWKLAPKEIALELCCKVTAALREKATQSEAHMQLARSLARANAGSLEQHGAALLRAGREILESAAGTEKWRHRVCAVQLLRAVMVAVNREKLSTELTSAAEVLDKFKLDKMQHVRNEAAKALQIVRRLADMEVPQSFVAGEPVLLSDGAFSGYSDGDMSISLSGKKNDRMKSLPESQIIQYSPSLVISSQSSNPAPGSCSSLGSPFPKLQPCSSFPSKNIQLKANMPKPRSTSSSSIDSDYSFADIKSKEHKDTVPNTGSLSSFCGGGSSILAGKSRDTALHDQVCGLVSHVSLCPLVFDPEKELYYGKRIENSDPAGLNQGRCGPIEITCNDGHKTALHTHAGRAIEPPRSQSGIDFCNLSQEILHENCLPGVRPNARQENFDCDSTEHKTPPRWCPTMVNNGRLVTQRETGMVSPRDFMTFSTPKRLVRSLQSPSFSPNSEVTTILSSKLAEDNREFADMDVETSSEAGWSVRHNPMAEGHESDKSELADAFTAEQRAVLRDPDACTFANPKSMVEEKGYEKWVPPDHSGMRFGGKVIKSGVAEGSSSETSIDSRLSTRSSGKYVQSKSVKECAADLIMRFEDTDYRSSKEIRQNGSSKTVSGFDVLNKLTNNGGKQLRFQRCKCVSSDGESESSTMSNAKVILSVNSYRFFTRVYESLVVLFGGSLCAIIFLSLAMILIRFLHPKENHYLVPPT